MIDTGGDGWNGNVLGIKQNNTIISTFGEYFTDGSNFSRLSLNVIQNASASVVIV